MSEERTERCRNCRFFSGLECRRYAPRPTMRQLSEFRRMEVNWTEVGKDGWCGEWQGVKAPAPGTD